MTSKAQTFLRILAAVLAALLPLVGLLSLLLRSELDPHIENYRTHFVVFGFVGGVAFILGYVAGEAAKRRGDARVLLLSLAFMDRRLRAASRRGGRRAAGGLARQREREALDAYVLFALS